MPQPDTIPDRASRKRKHSFVAHYGSTVLGQGVTLGLGVLTGVLSARMLGPVGRGEYTAIIIWPLWIATLLSLGINQAIVYYLGRKTHTVSEVATAAASIGLTQGALSIVIGLAVIPWVLAKYSPTVRHLAVVFVLMTPVSILGFYTANLFQGQQQFLRFNLIRVMAPFTYAAALVGLCVIHRTNLAFVIYSQVAGYIATFVIGSIMVGRILRPCLRWNKQVIPQLIHYGSRIQATNLASLFNQRVDQLLLSLFVAPEQLGLYAAAVTLSTAITVFPQAIGIVAFSRGSGQNREDAKATIGKSFRLSLLWLLVTCSIVYALSPVLIRLAFGPRFSGSIPACRILLPGALMIGLSQVLYSGASALGRPGLPSFAEGTSMAVTGVGLSVLVPHYGYIGAAIASTIAYTVSFLLMLVLAHTMLDITMWDLLRSKQTYRRRK